MTEPIIDPDVASWHVRTSPNGELSSVADAREHSRTSNSEAYAHMNPALIPGSESNEQIPGPAGPLPVRILRPTPDSPAARPRPTVVYFHGGGWVVGDVDTHLGHARRICMQADAVVVSVEYRRAPEDPFPAAYEDAYAAAEWAFQHAAKLGGEPDSLVLAGDSAGGQLAASVAIGRRDAGRPVTAQLLLYPVTDVAGRYASPKVNDYYMSRRTTKVNFGLTLQGMADFAHHYVSDAESTDWRVSPLRAADLSGLAPAVVHTATLDILRTEGNFYADALRRAGVRVISREWPTLNHSYFGLGGVSAVADGAAGQAAEDLHELLAGGGTTEAPPERPLPLYP
ncbi:MAG: alpha/beta hydrolase [Frankiales bacterium]|jgi:acetyl esterase|nr:alpha/beta hydrolase [Frankiales bacterium]